MANTVWVTFHDECGGYNWYREVVAIYATEELAKEAVARYKEADAVLEKYRPETLELDSTEEQRAFEEAHPDYAAAVEVFQYQEREYIPWVVLEEVEP